MGAAYLEKAHGVEPSTQKTIPYVRRRPPRVWIFLRTRAGATVAHFVIELLFGRPPWALYQAQPAFSEAKPGLRAAALSVRGPSWYPVPKK